MRNLALLVRKDFTGAIMNYGSVWMIIGIWLVVMIATPASAPLMFTVLIYLMVLSLFQTEENELVCNVIGILPIHKREAVIARYLYLYVLLAGQALIACILCPLVSLARGVDTQWRIPLVIALMSSLLMASVAIPLNYKFGVVKMRIITMIIYIVAVMASSALSPMLPYLSENMPETMLSLGAALAIALAAAVLLSLLSLAISIRIKR